MYKSQMMIVMRRDLKMRKGKIAAQAGHACIDAVLMALSKEGRFSDFEMRDEGIVLKNSEKQLFYTRLTSLAAMTIAAAVILCLIIVVPRLMTTITKANTIMTQATQTITLANTAIEGVTEMSTSITTMGTNMDTLITENSESVTAIMEKLEAIDFEGLNGAIEDLGEVVEPLANFVGKFK